MFDSNLVGKSQFLTYETNFVQYLLTDLIYDQDRKLDERLEQLSELSRIVAVVGD